MVLIFSNLPMREQLSTISLLSRSCRSVVDHHPTLLQHLDHRQGHPSNFHRAGTRPRTLSIHFTVTPTRLTLSSHPLLWFHLKNVYFHGHVHQYFLDDLAASRRGSLFDQFRSSTADKVSVHFESCACHLNTLQDGLTEQIELSHPTARYKLCASCHANRWWKQCNHCRKLACGSCAGICSGVCTFHCVVCQ